MRRPRQSTDGRAAGVLAVADVYGALTSERPYRPARGSDDALEIIRGDVPHRLDEEAVEALESLPEASSRASYSQLDERQPRRATAACSSRTGTWPARSSVWVTSAAPCDGGAAAPGSTASA